MKVLDALPNLSRALARQPPPPLPPSPSARRPVELRPLLQSSGRMPMHHFGVTPQNEVIFQHLAPAVKSELGQCPSLA